MANGGGGGDGGAAAATARNRLRDILRTCRNSYQSIVTRTPERTDGPTKTRAPPKMPQLILSNSERIAPAAVIVDDHKPVGTDVNFPDVLADLDVESLPDDVVEYGRVRVGETEESRTRLLAELEDMIYGENLKLAIK